MRKSPLNVVLTEDERRELLHVVRSPTAPHGVARRAQIVLFFAAGTRLSEIARNLSVQRCVVREWIKRFIKLRVPGLDDQPRPGARPGFSPRRRAAHREDRV